MLEFKLKVLKDLNNRQLAIHDVADKNGIHEFLLTKWKEEEKCIYHMLCCWTNKKKTSKKGTSKYETPCSVCETLQTICESKKHWKKSFICMALHYCQQN